VDRYLLKKYIFTAIWAFLFIYLMDFFEIEKNILSFLVGLTIIIGIGLFIFTFFENLEND
jgi:hypothetical protein